MNNKSQRVLYFIQSDHIEPLKTLPKTMRLKFDKLVLVSVDEKFISSAKSMFVAGEIIEVISSKDSIPINSVIFQSADDANSDLGNIYGDPLFKLNDSEINNQPNFKIKHQGVERNFSADEIKKLFDAGVIVRTDNGLYELAPGKSWDDVDQVLKHKNSPRPR